MLANTLLFVCLLCSLGVVRTQDCPDGYEYNSCGSQCAITCDNYEDPPVCLQACAPGCFCPEGTVEHNGGCITTDECPPTTPSCSESYEYMECGSPCTKTCDNYEEESICVTVCSTGCFCPEGKVEHEGMCITTDECPDISDTACSGGKEWRECGTACPLTCDNYDSQFGCTDNCVQGCFCPEGTVDLNGVCVDPASCSDATCSGGKEWQDCGTACPLTCDNYDDTSFACTMECVQGCFCPAGTVDLNGACVDPTSCADSACSGGKEWQECGTACPLTCDNYDTLFGCTEQCVQGCFCPAGTVDLNGACVDPTSCADSCSGGKEWQECGTACPLTCDNYEDSPFACTLQCVQGCFCPAGKVDLNGVCVNSTTCKDCVYCRQGQTCGAAYFEDYEYAECYDPIAVPCSEEYLPCPSNSRCVTHNVTGDSFCLESCYLDNGGCSYDQICYYEREYYCDETLGPCFTTACTDADVDVTDSCPPGWEMNPCGDICQRTCEDYLNGDGKFCPEICGPAECVCKPGMVVFRDRCVDPLECYSLLADEPDEPLLPENYVLLEVTLITDGTLDEFDPEEFARDVEQLIHEYGFEDVTVSVFDLFENENGNTVIILMFEGKSIEGEESVEILVEIMLENPGALSHEVVAVQFVDTQPQPEPRTVTCYGEKNHDVVISVTVVVGVVVMALIAVIVILTVTICLVRKNRAMKRALKAPNFEKIPGPSYVELSSKEEMT